MRNVVGECEKSKVNGERKVLEMREGKVMVILLPLREEIASLTIELDNVRKELAEKASAHELGRQV